MGDVMDCDMVKIAFLVSLLGNGGLFFWAIWQRDKAYREAKKDFKRQKDRVERALRERRQK
jgi:hypothetical protein